MYICTWADGGHENYELEYTKTPMKMLKLKHKYRLRIL